jgi:hypothetical protein
VTDTERRLAEIREREQAETPGPWQIQGIANAYRINGGPRLRKVAETPAGRLADAKLIAAAPCLRAEVTRLTAERDALRAAGQSVTARCRTWVSWRDSEGVERCDVCNEPTTAHNPTCPAALIWQEPTKEATDGK